MKPAAAFRPTPPLTHAMHDVLHRMARARRPPLQSVPVADARAAYEAGADVLEIARPAGVTATDFTIPMRDGVRVKARHFRPVSSATQKLPLLVYFHGGGFVIGSIATHDIFCRRISELAGCAVVSVDYRLAPEHRFPTAAHDAWDALQWLHAHAA